MLAIQRNLTNSFYALLSLPSTAMGFALSVQISALSWILSTKYQLKIEEVGLVWAAGPIAGIFGQVIIGLISDKVWFWNGRRRPFILIGGVLAGLMLLALPNIDIISNAMGSGAILGVAITIALTLDLAINVSFNPTRSIIADVTPEGEKRTKGYTWMQTISGAFGVGAYAVGAIWDNYILIYSGALLVFLLSFIPTFFIEEPRQLGNSSEEASASANVSSGKNSLWDILKAIQPLWGFLIYAIYGMTGRLTGWAVPGYIVEVLCLILTIGLIAQALVRKETGADAAPLAGFKKVLAAHAFTWVGIQSMFVYMFAYVQDKLPELGDTDMGRVVSISFLILNAVGALLPAFLLEPLTRRIGRVNTHMVCIAIMALGYAGIWLMGKSPATIYVLMGILGIGWAATVSLPFAIMSQKVDQARMGLYMGLFNLSVVLPQLVASLGVGQAVGQAADKSLLFIICAFTLGISALFWFFVQEPENHERKTAPAGGAGH
ncbi:MAG: MFS transporter [Haliscomenobacter sp.]|nr:MFS transporter [Haliscomenobacter sp.]